MLLRRLLVSAWLLASAALVRAEDPAAFENDHAFAARHMTLGPVAQAECGETRLGGYSDDGTLAITWHTFQLDLWSVAPGRIALLLRLERPLGWNIEACALDPAGERIVIVHGSRSRRRVIVWRMVRPTWGAWRLEPLLELRDPAGAQAAGFRPDGALWVATEQRLKVFASGPDLRRLGELGLGGERVHVSQVRWAGEGSLATGDLGGAAWRPGLGEALHGLPQVTYRELCADLSPDGQWAATGSYPQEPLHLFRLGPQEVTRTWSLPVGVLVRAVAFDPRGRWLVAGGADGGLRFWALGKGEPAPLPTLPGTGGGVRDLRWDARGERLLSIQAQRLVLYELGRRRPALPGALSPARPAFLPETTWEQPLAVSSLTASPSGQLLAGLVGPDLVVWALEAERGALRELARAPHTLPAPEGGLRSVETCRFLDEERLVVWSQSVTAPARLAVFRRQDERLSCVAGLDEPPPQREKREWAAFVLAALDPQGRWLLSNGRQTGLRCHDLSAPDLREVPLAGGPDMVRRVPYRILSYPGRRWLMGGSIGLQLWEGRPGPAGGLELALVGGAPPRHALTQADPTVCLPDGRVGFAVPRQSGLRLVELHLPRDGQGDELRLGAEARLGHGASSSTGGVALHPAGQWVMLVDRETSGQMWSLGPGAPRLLAHVPSWSDARELQHLDGGRWVASIRRPLDEPVRLRLDRLPLPAPVRIGDDPIVWGWSPEPPGAAPPGLTGSLRLTPVEPPASGAVLAVKLTNEGSEPLHLVRGELQVEDDPGAACLPLFFGTLRPGTTVLRRVPLPANEPLLRAGARLTLRLAEQHERPLAPLRLVR